MEVCNTDFGKFGHNQLIYMHIYISLIKCCMVILNSTVDLTMVKRIVVLLNKKYLLLL